MCVGPQSLSFCDPMAHLFALGHWRQSPPLQAELKRNPRGIPFSSPLPIFHFKCCSQRRPAVPFACFCGGWGVRSGFDFRTPSTIQEIPGPTAPPTTRNPAQPPFLRAVCGARNLPLPPWPLTMALCLGSQRWVTQQAPFWPVFRALVGSRQHHPCRSASPGFLG